LYDANPWGFILWFAMLIKLHGPDAIERRGKKKYMNEEKIKQNVALELGATLAGCEFRVVGCLVALGAQLFLLLKNPVLVLSRLALTGANARIVSPNKPCKKRQIKK
jgi:hypothetical protein